MSRLATKTLFYLLITLILFALIGYQLWLAWPSLMIKSTQWQREINDALSQLLHQAKQNQSGAAWSLIGLSTLYGFLHALGPGHGKIIVTTYLATHPTKVKTSLWITVLSALLQAVVACVLVTSLLWIFQASMKQVNQESLNFIKASYGIMILLGIVILLKAMRAFYSLLTQKNQKKSQLNFQSFKHQATGNAASTFIIKPQNHQHDYQEDGLCGCGHKHIASQEEINQATHLSEYIAIITSIGIRPCTGAIMVLLFSNVLDIYWLGIVSSFAMSIGTALSTSCIALFTVSGRQFVRRYLSAQTNQYNTMISLTLKCLAGLVLSLLGLLLWQSQAVGMSPFLG